MHLILGMCGKWEYKFSLNMTIYYTAFQISQNLISVIISVVSDLGNMFSKVYGQISQCHMSSVQVSNGEKEGEST